MSHRLLLFALFTGLAVAQQVVAPTPEQVGSARGENVDDYNVVDSFELGYRFATIGGNLDTYRSNVNYGNGIRLLSSFLTVNSRDGHGRLFDELVLTTQGLGNDPYESATLRIAKNRLYKYDFTWRLNDYFNPGLVTGGANGLRLYDTQYTTQDQNFTLFPQSNLQFFLGYSRGLQTGPAITAVPSFNAQSGNVFPVFANTHRERNEFRIGNEFKLLGVRVNWMHGWEDFKEDTPYYISGLTPGTNPNDPSTLSSFQRTAPYHGTSPYWRVGIFAGNKWWAVNGRFSYAGGQGAFILDESAIGTATIGPANRQIVTQGNGQRPVATGNLSVSLFPTDRLSIVNTTSVYNVRTEGDAQYIEYDNASQTANFLSFQYLGILTVANSTDLNYAWKKWLSIFAGYHYTDRRISSVLFQGMAPYDQTNILNSGNFGFRVQPIHELTITFDGEIGHASQPFAPRAEKNYHTLAGRIQYKHKNLRLSASTKADYNVNSISVTSYSSQARTYSADASWTPRSWLVFDAGYNKQHLNALGGIAYFVNDQEITGQDSLYISNLHTVFVGVQVNLTKRIDLYLAYNRVQDTGDGRDNVYGSGIGATLPALQAAQTFPLTYQAPLARVSVKLANKLRWNAGYEYYGYREKFYSSDNYRANTGYTSLLFSF